MHHMRTFVASTCMHVVHSSGFRFSDDFEYSSYLIPYTSVLVYKGSFTLYFFFSFFFFGHNLKKSRAFLYNNNKRISCSNCGSPIYWLPTRSNGPFTRVLGAHSHRYIMGRACTLVECRPKISC